MECDLIISIGLDLKYQNQFQQCQYYSFNLQYTQIIQNIIYINKYI